MPALLTCDSIAPPERRDYWQTCLREQFGIDARVEPQPGTQFSSSLVAHQIGPLILSDHWGSSVSAAARPCDKDDSLLVWLQTEGTSSVASRGRVAELQPGDFCLHRGQDAIALQMHASECGHAPWHFLHLELPVSQLAARFPGWERHVGKGIRAQSGSGAMFGAMLKSLNKHGELVDDGGAQHIADSTIGLLAAALASQNACGDDSSSHMETYHRERIKNFVCANLCNPNLDVATIAQGVGLSPGHVHRLFSKENVPLMQGVWSERLRRCYQELASGRGGRSISGIAYAWGFNDAAHFSRAFRKCFGVSPREVRDAHTAAAGDVTVIVHGSFRQ